MAMRRPSFDDAVIAPHLAFLDELRAAGQLEMTGGFSDRSGGAYMLVNITSLEEAKAIAARDPLALTGTSDLTVYEWNTR
ncbi:MAG: YciI family protein [Pseudoxanthomonas sp.]|uniref:YciI family protein n=1 Tax=Pseudoxanthomonas sp. TaxID=1871049 RepID=UPI0028C3A7A4|nr:YciI family protein [Pseudoxanthomonas sp.]MCR6627197.1 YciI family protein [Pseudoxanthomonas sp.]